MASVCAIAGMLQSESFLPQRHNAAKSKAVIPASIMAARVCRLELSRAEDRAVETAEMKQQSPTVGKHLSLRAQRCWSCGSTTD